MHRSNPISAVLWSNTSLTAIENYVKGFFVVNWTSETVQDLQNTITNGPVGAYCASVGTGVSAILDRETFHIMG